MNGIQDTLRSERGATLLLALIFMLICVFIGSSVLVAATVNGGRLAGKREEQQDVLTQRSIISAFVNTMPTTPNGSMLLEVPIGKDAGGVSTVQIPEEAEGVQRAIFTAAKEAFDTGNGAGRTDFTVTVTRGGDSEPETVACYAACDPITFTVNVCFQETDTSAPQVQLVLTGIRSDDAVRWYSAEVRKANLK